MRALTPAVQLLELNVSVISLADTAYLPVVGLL